MVSYGKEETIESGRNSRLLCSLVTLRCPLPLPYTCHACNLPGAGSLVTLKSFKHHATRKVDSPLEELLPPVVSADPAGDSDGNAFVVRLIV